jgi:tetratricopeptide (TPR) repeat protein
LALANVAVQLARMGSNVLIVDWDLEAPGLDRYFTSPTANELPGVSTSTPRDRTGLMGLLHDASVRRDARCSKLYWQSRIVEISVPAAEPSPSLPTPLSPRQIDFLPSGYGGEEYAKRLAEFSWVSFFSDAHGAEWLEDLRDQWADEYEFVLIDSRTGLTDSGGVCTIQMPHMLVLVFTANDQSLDGGLRVVAAAQKERRDFAFDRPPLAVVPLLSRWEGENEVDIGEQWMKRLDRELAPLTAPWLPKDFSPRHFIEKTRVPHVPRFTFGEPLPVLTHSLTDPGLPGLYYDLFAGLIRAQLSTAGKIIDPNYRDVKGADIFISYAATDRDWAFWIAKELQLLGHTPHVHEWEVKGGDDMYAWMEARQDAADHLLCVVSDEYLRSPLSTLERQAGLWRAARDHPGFVLVVVVKPCRLPTLFDHLRRCELVGVSEEAARLRFREFMVLQASPRQAVEPKFRSAAISNIPVRVPMHFVGREDALSVIERGLAREGRVVITALHGMRGVGKTTLAAAYAERHRNDYRATWWIRAQSEITIRTDLVALGIRLGWVAANDKDDAALAAVMERLRHEGEGILLICDNASESRAIEPYLPPASVAQVLITSNAYAWRGFVEPVEIRPWPTAIGSVYLVASTGRTGERAAAETLSEALGGLPLAHEQAVAYCETQGISLGQYAGRFASAPTPLLDDAGYAPAAYPQTIAKTFALAIEGAIKLHPAAEPLILHAALLAPEPIPLFLFSEAREKLGNPLGTVLTGDGLEEAIAALRTFGLLHRAIIIDDSDPSITTDTINLHSLVGEAVADRCDKTTKDAMYLGLLSALAQVYPKDGHNPALWPRCALLTPHVLVVCNWEFSNPATAKECARLLNAAGTYFCGRAAYLSARPLFERALSIDEKVLGPVDTATAESLSNLAALLEAQGDLAGARPLYARALAIRQAALGPENPHTAASLINLARLFLLLGQHNDARELIERALTIRERMLGPDHPETAKGLYRLAHLLFAQDDLMAARSLYQRALTIQEKVLGLDDPDTATSLNGLGQLLHAQGDLGGARPLLERALAIREKVLGHDHPDTAESLSNLAALLQADGDVAAARPLLERALAIREKAHGPEHPKTATSLSNLARLFLLQGDFVAPRPLLERALAIREKVLGPEHPDTAGSLTSLAALFRIRGDLASARLLEERALEIYEKALGPEHPRTVEVRGRLERSLQGDMVRLGEPEKF